MQMPLALIRPGLRFFSFASPGVKSPVNIFLMIMSDPVAKSFIWSTYLYQQRLGVDENGTIVLDSEVVIAPHFLPERWFN